MSPELLNLHISQLSRTFDKSKTNNYSDERKQKYHQSLVELFDKIKSQDLSNLDYPKQCELKDVLDFCFLSIEFLDNSTLVNFPYEIVYCLEKALNEWDTSDKYIIVTSLQNNIYSYSFNPILALNESIYILIENSYNVIFSNRLIQINLPKYLANDYLANVVLYHELGHFIDLRYFISRRICLRFSWTEPVKLYHLGEFFSDVFAAQYIGSASNYYLDYIAHKNPASLTHPATDMRIKMVEDFLNSNSGNNDLDILLDATKTVTGKDLTISTDALPSDDFLNFIPANIQNDRQLHSIFETGWRLWKENVDKYNDRNIDQEAKYVIINNLIEKSISNYMITEKWSKHVSDKNGNP